MKNRAVFLDRDGVLVRDNGPLTRLADARVLPGAAEALDRLKEAGFLLVCVSNQTVIARGLANEKQVEAIQSGIEDLLQREGAPRLDGFYYCPHHPSATVERYRTVCGCRKPGAGLLRLAAGMHDIDLAQSYMIGDRPTDIAAGVRAHCTTILVRTGRHSDPLIEVGSPFIEFTPAATRKNLSSAADWILEHEKTRKPVELSEDAA
jgi:D-glycero-D-manno-heptose 1,7-bisphosphate phosphatase